METPYGNSSLEHHVRMVANVYDAHTAALFIQAEKGGELQLAAKESLSRQFVSGCVIRPGEGLLGWVAREQRRIHVTSFQRDTRTLGVYARDVRIRALLAAPLPDGRGVLMVDSRNRHAFPEKKQKLLDDFALVAWNIWQAEKELHLLTFYRNFNHDLLAPGLGLDQAAVRTAKLLGLDTVLVATWPHKTKKYRVETVWRGGRDSSRWDGCEYDIDQGYAGWFFRKGINLLIRGFRGDSRKSCLLADTEILCRGSVLLGIVLKGGMRDRLVMFTGDANASFWPDDLPEMVGNVLALHAGPDGMTNIKGS